MANVNMTLEEIITTNRQKGGRNGRTAGGNRRSLGGGRRTEGGGIGGFPSGGMPRREKYFSDGKSKHDKLADIYDPSKNDLGNAELTRLWNINPNNLEAFAYQQGRGSPCITEFIEDMLDEIDPNNAIDESFKPLSSEEIRWVASNFLLFNSDQYFICANSWSGKNRDIVKFLTKVILQTARTIPELQPYAEKINAAMLQKSE